METFERSLLDPLAEEVKDWRKMLFVAGPRQVGKTTLLTQLASLLQASIYNWDNLNHRKQIVESPYAFFETPEKGVFFDEIHKFPRWKNYLKGCYDTYGKEKYIAVTGSARLTVYRRGGDSLLGRYILHRLHPFTVGEVIGKINVEKPSLERLLNPGSEGLSQGWEVWQALEVFGGFPEPYLLQSEARLQVWRAQRKELLVREDIRDLTRLRELALLEQLIVLIPARIGSPLSLNSLRQDLGISHDAIRSWIQVLSDFFFIFLIPPYTKKVSRAILKERKVYLWDYAELEDPGVRFENMIASHLLKWTQYVTDAGKGELSLAYLRDKEKQEVDFVVLYKRKPWLLIEAKRSEKSPVASLLDFSRKLGKVPVIQLVNDRDFLVHKTIDGIPWTGCSASRFFKDLP